MADLKLAVKNLTGAATKDVDPKELRPKVEAVLEAFDGAREGAQLAAVKAVAAALMKAKGRGEQVLALALGAMVEGGAPPEAAWPATEKGLAATLEQATAFAHAVTNAAGSEDLASALGSHGAVVAVLMPGEAAAWKSMSARCLTAVACLARSKEVRAKARKDASLAEAAWELSDAVGEVGALLQALSILDDAVFEVRDPATKKTWRLVVDGVSANAELYLLVAHATGAKVDAKVLASLRAGEAPKKKRVTLPFTLGIDPEELASDTARALVLRPGAVTIETAHLPVLEGLRPDVRVDDESGVEEVEEVRVKPRPRSSRPLVARPRAAPKGRSRR
ncbi:MAG: hypothetical protein KIT84_26095 [Labilithrix sp.]|nr:hypothetical protein [Labilithrix sp.]MCW5814527.1 hypothetical protein [Labilithrix sp.]